MAAANLTAERARELLDYDVTTGSLSWRVPRGPHTHAGAIAGTLTSYGYRVVCIDNRQHYAHRVVWLIVNGKWPDSYIDHMNGARADNRLANLRDVSREINCQNQRNAMRNNKSSGLLGAWRSRNGRWKTAIHVDGKRQWLGVFASAEAAHAAYLAAKRAIHKGNTL